MDNNLRAKYEQRFSKYPDVLELKDLLEMLGGVSESYVRPLLQKGLIRNFRLSNRKEFKIPKEYFIDYVVSDEYQREKHKLKAQI